MNEPTQTTGDLMRWLSACALTRAVGKSAAETFIERWPRSLNAPLLRQELEQRQKAFEDARRQATLPSWETKAAVLPGDHLDAVWAKPLAGVPSTGPLLSLVQKESLLGRIAGLRQVPFNTKIPLQNVNATFAWVASNAPKPVTKLGFTDVTLPIGKVAGILTLTKELVQLSAPGSESAMKDAMVGALVQFQDTQLLDPAVTLIADTRPKSLTNGVTPTTAGADVKACVAAVLKALYTARPNTAKPTVILSPANADVLAASLYTPASPLVITPAAGVNIIALDANAVAYADGGLVIDQSEQAAIEMNDAPATATAATVIVDLWSRNLVGFRVERALWWVAVSGAVQYTVAP